MTNHRHKCPHCGAPLADDPLRCERCGAYVPKWIGTRWRFWTRLALLGALLVVVGISVRPLPPRSSVRVAARLSVCKYNLKQIFIALEQYHDTCGSYPQAISTSEFGEVKFSWRALLLPFLDYHEPYNFDKPWNGPSNSQIGKMFEPYACPSESGANMTMTNYVAIIGPRTAFPADRSSSRDQISDAPSQTILMVEVDNSGIQWLEPRDLTVTEFVERLRQTASRRNHRPHASERLFGRGRTFFYALMADGNVKPLPVDIAPETLRALLTIDGGETVELPVVTR